MKQRRHLRGQRRVFALAVLAMIAGNTLSCGGGGGGGGSGFVAPPPSASPVITTQSLPEGYGDESYSATMQASGGTPPYTWRVLPAPTSGPIMWLHAGLTLSATSGAITGTPTEFGTFGPVFEVRDSAGRTGTRQILLLMRTGLGLTSTLPDAVLGRIYTSSVSVTGGRDPWVLTILPSSDPLPPGLSHTIGTFEIFVRGHPTATGSAQLRYQVVDARGRTANATIPFRVVTPLIVQPNRVPAAGVGFPYSQAFTASGGTPPYRWGVRQGGSVPAGLALAADGTLSGTPTNGGFFPLFSIEATDSGTPPQVVGSSANLSVVTSFTVTKINLNAGVVDKSYQEVMEAAGGLPPFTWSLLPPQFPHFTLPPGVNLATDGTASGVPTSTGFFQADIEARDSSNPPRVASARVFINVLPRLHFLAFSGVFPDGAQGVSYGSATGMDGGLRPYRARIVSGSVPPGLTFDASGLFPNFGTSFGISGLPTAQGRFTFDVEVSDSTTPPDVLTRTYSIDINAPLAFAPPAQLPEGLEGAPYSVSFTATGGKLPLTWSLGSGGVGGVAGLSINASTGVVSGTPAQEFSGTASITVQDSSSPPQIVGVQRPLRIYGLLRVTTSGFPNLRPGDPVSLRPQVTGGLAPFTWSITAGGLPSGVSLNSNTGELTGAPSSIGAFPFTLRVQDSNPAFPQNVQRAMAMNILTSPGRNDTIATASPLSNGRVAASLSPADSNGTFTADTDYFRITANAGATVSVEIFAERLNPSSPLDTVIEIVDASGVRLGTCSAFGPFSLFQPCLNDDEFSGGSLDSRIFMEVPGSPGTTTTFYVRVLSFDGNARPDYRYEIAISGAN